VNRTEPNARTNARRPKKGAARERALAMLLEGRTVPDVAAELGCGRVTVWAWTKDPGFAAELATRRDASRDLAEMHMADAAVQAVETLRAVMAMETADPGCRWRIAAAETVLRVVWPKPNAAAVAIAGAAAPASEIPNRDPEREAIVADILASVAGRLARTPEIPKVP
jgi:hypothetical protein